MSLVVNLGFVSEIFTFIVPSSLPKLSLSFSLSLLILFLFLSPLTPQSWKKRWCVLCRTQDGVSIFYYNKQSSYTNLDMPVGIFFLDECRKIFTIPGHPKSRSVFAIDFPYRTVHMYPEKE